MAPLCYNERLHLGVSFVMRSNNMKKIIIALATIVLAGCSLKPILVNVPPHHYAIHLNVDKIKPKPPSPVITVDTRGVQVNCLAKNIYYEARGESLRGKLAVGFVTLNRVRSSHYPDTICGVVKQNYLQFGRYKVCQFSWYCEDGDAKINSVIDTDTYESIRELSKKLIAHKYYNFIPHVYNFHKVGTYPWWFNDKKGKRIGNHIFS